MFDLSKWLNKWLQISNLEKFLSTQEELFSIDDRVLDLDKQIAELKERKEELIQSKPILQEKMKSLSMQLFDKTKKTDEITIDSTSSTLEEVTEVTEEIIENKDDVGNASVLDNKNIKKEENSKKETISLKIPNNIQKNEGKVDYSFNRDPVFEKLRDKKISSLVDQKFDQKNEDNKDDVTSFLLRFNSWDKKEKISNFTKERFVV